MIFSELANAMRAAPPQPPPPVAPYILHPEFISAYGITTESGQIVSPETTKNVSTAYRCGNILSDDIAGLPFQMYVKNGRDTQRVLPDSVVRNVAYLLEVAPNRWMSPFIFKKTLTLWLLYWGNAYIWQPSGAYREWFILPSSMTFPVFDADGYLWYHTIYPNGKSDIIPEVEILHLMINSTDGLVGRSIIRYARETIGRQIGAHQTSDMISGNGLKPSALLWVNGEVDEPAREKIRRSYTNATSTSSNAGRALVLDNKIAKFESITINPHDAQFLETTEATDAEIANYFGVPLYKLNMGKQSYESNEQQQIDYLRSTLNPYLTQWEQAARRKWLTQEEQDNTYFRFIREALLQTDAKTRSEYLEKKILSGQMSPNEARLVEDQPVYQGGDSYYMPANYGKLQDDGSILTTTAPAAATTGGD